MDQYVADREVESRKTMAAAAAVVAVGAKRSSYERDKELFLEKRCKYYWEDDDDDAFEMPVVGTKRGYERDEEKSDVISVKRYKCNYWEDPAKARDLQRWGGRLAQIAAQDTSEERFLTEIHAWNLARVAPASYR